MQNAEIVLYKKLVHEPPLFANPTVKFYIYKPSNQPQASAKQKNSPPWRGGKALALTGWFANKGRVATTGWFATQVALALKKKIAGKNYETEL
ncbi:MAG: hypothetical protein LBM65_04430 [Oscillospiraceae bacterium]|jgi:hypothetical protein|nr:hypothetical protein [Oscillospiraceae bacterium]